LRGFRLHQPPLLRTYGPATAATTRAPQRSAPAGQGLFFPTAPSIGSSSGGRIF
jgi:hypothetical protein